jgi:hypothetical protein
MMNLMKEVKMNLKEVKKKDGSSGKARRSKHSWIIKNIVVALVKKELKKTLKLNTLASILQS